MQNKIRQNNIKKIIFIILIIINCSVIFYFSNQVADDSTQTSSTVIELLKKIIPSLSNYEDILSIVVRKLAHFSIYTLLGIFTINWMNTYKGRSFYQKGLVSLLFCVFYAITDEIHQYFIAGRSCEFRDVCIDTLGALTGILIVVIITKIYRKITNKKQEKYKIDKDTKILFISSTGGHFIELMKLKPLMEKCNYHIVTEKTKTNEKLKDKYGKKINFLLYATRQEMKIYPFVLIANCFISLWVFIKNRPQVIITTGTHTAGPMCCIAKLLGSKVIYIETFANRNTKTSTGKLLYNVADTFVVQWEEMLELYPKAEYWGWIF